MSASSPLIPYRRRAPHCVRDALSGLVLFGDAVGFGLCFDAGHFQEASQRAKTTSLSIRLQRDDTLDQVICAGQWDARHA